jgi:hypothetical protein
MEVHWRPTINVIDIPSSYQAISLIFSAIETVLKNLVVFLLSILKKIAVTSWPSVAAHANGLAKTRTYHASKVFPGVNKHHKLKKLAFHTIAKNRQNF